MHLPILEWKYVIRSEQDRVGRRVSGSWKLSYDNKTHLLLMLLFYVTFSTEIIREAEGKTICGLNCVCFDLKW